jgi:hypothetical protein
MRMERPYFQSSVVLATGTVNDQTRSRGSKWLRDEGETSKSLYRGWKWSLEVEGWSPS